MNTIDELSQKFIDSTNNTGVSSKTSLGLLFNNFMQRMQELGVPQYGFGIHLATWVTLLSIIISLTLFAFCAFPLSRQIKVESAQNSQ